ncbi:MAG: CPBP family intramembrane glutamic endopeptidase [Pseudomonadota bacterium]
MPLTIFSFLLMFFAFLAVWSSTKIKGQPLWLLFLCLGVCVGLYAQVLLPVSILWVGLALLAFFALHKLPHIRPWIFWPLAVYLLVMGMRLLPGFPKIVFIEALPLGRSSHPVGLEYDLAKPIAGLLAFALIAQRCNGYHELWKYFTRFSNWLIPAGVVIVAAVLLGVPFDVKWVWWTPLFIVSNIILSVIPEEAFFRGFLQQPLQNKFGKAIWIVPIVGVLFAAVHSAPPHIAAWKFYTLFALAGSAYAWSFQRTGKTETAIFTHTTVNALHFLFLTYPVYFPI